MKPKSITRRLLDAFVLCFMPSDLRKALNDLVALDNSVSASRGQKFVDERKQTMWKVIEEWNRLCP